MDSIDIKGILDGNNKKKPDEDIDGLGVGIADEPKPQEISSAEDAYGMGTVSPAVEKKAESNMGISGEVSSYNNEASWNTYQPQPQQSYQPQPQRNYQPQQSGYGSQQGYQQGGTTDSSSYLEESRVLGRVNKIKTNIRNAEWFLFGLAILNVIVCLGIVLFSGLAETFEFSGILVSIMCFTPLLYIPLAFGIGRKSEGCAIAAIVFAALDLAGAVLSFSIGGIVFKVVVLMAYITAFKSIKEYHQLEARYMYDPNYRISQHFEKTPLAMTGKYVAMIIFMVLSLCIGIFSFAAGTSELFSGISSSVSSSSINEWKRYEIGEGNISLLLPTEPTEVSTGSSSMQGYMADGGKNAVTIVYADALFEGCTEMQKQSIVDAAVKQYQYYDEGFTLIETTEGEDNCGKYYQMVFTSKTEYVVMRIVCVGDNLDVIGYTARGDYDDDAKAEVDVFYGKIYRTY